MGPFFRGIKLCWFLLLSYWVSFNPTGKGGGGMGNFCVVIFVLTFDSFVRLFVCWFGLFAIF